MPTGQREFAGFCVAALAELTHCTSKNDCEKFMRGCELLAFFEASELRSDCVNALLELRDMAQSIAVRLEG